MRDSVRNTFPSARGRLLDGSWTALGRIQNQSALQCRANELFDIERESARYNADVTRYVTGGVTVPRPDPTRPDPFSRYRSLASHRYLGPSRAPRRPADRRPMQTAIDGGVR